MIQLIGLITYTRRHSLLLPVLHHFFRMACWSILFHSLILMNTICTDTIRSTVFSKIYSRHLTLMMILLHKIDGPLLTFGRNALYRQRVGWVIG